MQGMFEQPRDGGQAQNQFRQPDQLRAPRPTDETMPLPDPSKIHLRQETTRPAQPRPAQPRPVQPAQTQPRPTQPRPAQPRAAAPAHTGKKKKKKSKPVGLIVSIVAVVLVLLIVAGVYVYGLLLQNDNKIYPNVYVAGVNVGGMDRLQAIDTVRDAVADSYSAVSLDVRLPDRTLSFQPEQTKVALDVHDAIAEALAYGRDGNAFSAISGYLNAKKTTHYIDIETMLELDTEYISRMIENVASNVDRPATPTQVEYNTQTGELIVNVGVSGRVLDQQGLYDAVYDAFMTGNFSPITWDYETTPVEPLDLTPYHDHYCTDMENAVYDEETHTIRKEVEGFGFELEPAQQQLDKAAEGTQLVFRLNKIPTEVTAEQLEEEMFGTMLYTVSTPYVNNPGRTRNLELACLAIDGTVLNPDEVFSFNDIVGERTADKGYQGATVYVEGGASEEQLGGGVCQVASSIYYATLFLDLEQVWREPHMYKVDYVPYGMDVTVYWGQIDYRFRNSLSHPMRIEANIDNGCVNITFYGVKENDYTIVMDYEILETYPWVEVEEVDEEKPVGYRELAETPYTGYKVVTYKSIYDENGNLISKKKEATSDYKKRDKKYIVGPSEETLEPPIELDPILPPPEEEEYWP